MTERVQKVWGERFKLFENDLCEVCFLDLLPMKRCSWHNHRSKSNFFFVIEGQLGIKTRWGKVILNKNEFFTVHPTDEHEFRTFRMPTKIIEIAWVKLDPEDISRSLLGGELPQWEADDAS